jgi:hypothetical protein
MGCVAEGIAVYIQKIMPLGKAPSTAVMQNVTILFEEVREIVLMLELSPDFARFWHNHDGRKVVKHVLTPLRRIIFGSKRTPLTAMLRHEFQATLALLEEEGKGDMRPTKLSCRQVV